MVQVVKEVRENAPPPSDFMSSLTHNLPIILIVLVVVGLIVAIVWLIKKKNDDDKRRDHPIYNKYCFDVESCQIKAKHTWINCRYSFVNLWLLGIPLFWKEHSAKVRDRDNEVIGFYRGHSYTQDGYLNLLVYKSRKWLVIENTFIIKCPYSIDYLVRDGDKFCSDGKTPKTKKMRLNFDKHIKFNHNMNNDIMINCFNLECDNYYTYPVYISDKNEPIDLRQFNNENIIELGQGVMLAQVFEDGSRYAQKAMAHNPAALYEQAKPQKTQEIKE
jgi:hypothetical protein